MSDLNENTTEHLQQLKRIVLAIVNDESAPQYIRDNYAETELAPINVELANRGEL